MATTGPARGHPQPGRERIDAGCGPEVHRDRARSGRREGDRRTGLFVLAAAVAGVVLLALGQGLTFFADEWAVIEGRSLDVGSFLRPFNEHWLGTTIVVYRLMFGIFGLGSYVPYLSF